MRKGKTVFIGDLVEGKHGLCKIRCMNLDTEGFITSLIAETLEPKSPQERWVQIDTLASDPTIHAVH